jgi:F-type H+-transporting ATPase subunit c
MNSGIIALAVSICMLTAVGAGIGISMATGKATEAAARQPEAAKNIRSILLIGSVLAEATAIYGMFIAFLLLSKM